MKRLLVLTVLAGCGPTVVSVPAKPAEEPAEEPAAVVDVYRHHSLAVCGRNAGHADRTKRTGTFATAATPRKLKLSYASSLA